MRHEATLFFPFPDPLADAIAGALHPEAARNEVPKTRGHVARARGGVQLTLHADDLPSLRATINSHLRWVDAATKAANLASDRHG
jgi:tRNA threonylcarbamoyladenosine modification (KEOPS) complex  Pcc1 subunit